MTQKVIETLELTKRKVNRLFDIRDESISINGITQDSLGKCIDEALSELKENNWQPIEAAPKDATNILIYSVGFEKHVIGYWNMHVDSWQAQKGVYINHPTHWMPLPQPPNIKGE